MAVTFGRNHEEVRVRISGEMGLWGAADTHRALAQCLEQGVPVVFQLDDLTTLELPLFQLIHTFQRAAARRGLAVRREGGLAAGLREELDWTGAGKQGCRVHCPLECCVWRD